MIYEHSIHFHDLFNLISANYVNEMIKLLINIVLHPVSPWSYSIGILLNEVIISISETLRPLTTSNENL